MSLNNPMDNWEQFLKAITSDPASFKFGIVEDEPDDNMDVEDFPDYVINGLERVRLALHGQGQKIINVLYSPDKFVDAEIVGDDDNDGALLVTKYITALMAVANAAAKPSRSKINPLALFLKLLDVLDDVFDGPFNEDAFLDCDFEGVE